MKAHKRVYIGAATDPNTFNDTLVAQHLKTEFGCVTPENSMKWESTERMSPLGKARRSPTKTDGASLLIECDLSVES